MPTAHPRAPAGRRPILLRISGSGALRAAGGLPELDALLRTLPAHLTGKEDDEDERDSESASDSSSACIDAESDPVIKSENLSVSRGWCYDICATLHSGW